ncbi:class I SAM-dependent methyltransferase [Streptomyces koyangensis]|uniref:class I SAM-dependent methyltransferase n=2 Tax=Streptomyces TaxID=1883 RepID=UPI001CB96196|nr:class I SAM-dependent methyltransferase [Streptomyces sp. EAG2]
MGYGKDAEALAQQYEEVPFERVHGHLLRWLPSAAGRAVDIGAGSGRDAAALAARGHEVVAVEPTPELRQVGRRLHGDAPIDWVDDALPALPRFGGPSTWCCCPRSGCTWTSGSVSTACAGWQS